MVTAGELMWSGRSIDREIFQALDGVTQRMKGRGIVMTLSPKLQMAAIANVVSSGLAGKKTEDQIVAEFLTNVAGDTTLYRDSIGSDAWESLLSDAAFPEQELSNLQRLPALIEAMAKHVKAESSRDRTMLRGVIHSLHDLDLCSFQERENLLEKIETEWLDFEALFGVALPTIE